MTENGSFIDFIIALKDREDLYKGFLKCTSTEELMTFFGQNNYDVPENDCTKLCEAMQTMGISEDGIPPAY